MNVSAPWGRPPGLPLQESSDTPAKVRDAGRQFEALLIGQILHSARESGSSTDCATDFADEKFAEVLAQSGGLGIARMIEHSLQQPAPAASVRPLR